MKIALTGGIACGKSLVAKYLNDLGVATLDADDIVHELIPAEERRRLAAKVFNDPVARRELEARIHPVVKSRIADWLAKCERDGKIAVAIIPLLFEVQWNREFDILLCVTSEETTQVERMRTRRGYTREEAEARLAAQMPVADKAARSHYVIANDGTADELRAKVKSLVGWLSEKSKNL